MSDTLNIFGTEYTNVAGIIATNTSDTDLTYIRPQGTKSISANGTGIDVTEYASVNVAVPSEAPTLQTKSVSYTPTETAQSATVTADSGYDGLDEVSVSVGAISSTYVGSGITQRSSTDLTASGATVTVPSGYYSSQASKAVSSGTEGTPTATKGTVSNHSISVTPSVTNTAGYISGGTKTGTAVSVSASELVSGTLTISSSGTKDVTNYASASVSSGSATPASTISATGASVSTGTNTLTLSKSVSNTPQVSAGYVSSGTAGNSSVSLTASVTTKAAATITPTTTNQTIASGTYLTGTQTISGDANLVAGNIKKNTSIFGVTGTYEGEGGSTMNWQAYLGNSSRTANSYGATAVTLTVAKAGTYTVSWTAWRSSSSGTMGTNLHVNDTTGTNQQTFTSTYGQRIELTNQHYNANDVLTIYATSGSNSRSIIVANLIIKQTA